MKRFLILSLTLMLALACPLSHARLPQPPEIAARQYVLLDLSSQQVLAERDADSQAEPASLTKLMTAYLVFQAIADGKLRLDTVVPISERAWKAEGSRTFLEVGTRVQ